MGRDPVLARYQGGQIRSSDLGRYLLQVLRRESLAAISRMVGEEILRREATDLGVELPRSWVVEEGARIRAAVEREALRAYGVGASSEDYVKQQFRQSLEEHLASRLDQAARRWLFARVIRYHAITTERVEVSICVVAEESEARAVLARIGSGESFGDLARRLSLHDSRERGGRLPALPLEALNPAVATVVSRMKPGDLSDVITVESGVGLRYEIVRLEGRIPPKEGRWDSLQGEVERSLAQTPLAAHEWTAWMLRLERLYKVELSANL